MTARLQGSKASGAAALDVAEAQSRVDGQIWITDSPYNAQATTDGSIDCLAAIHAAINAAPFGSTVVIPEPPIWHHWGTSAAINAKSGITILVPSNETRIVCYGNAPGVEWPTYGSWILGGYTTPNYWRTTAYSIANITAGQESVSVSSVPDAAQFIAGDVAVIETTSTYTIGSEDRPTWLQLNVVESVNTSTGVISLRYPIDSSKTSVMIRRLTRTGLKVQEASGSLSDYDLEAIRDFNIIGGTWETVKPAAPFAGGGGAINCKIKPYKTRCAYGVPYGNLYAYCEMGEDYFEGRISHAELAFGSHDNVVKSVSAHFIGSAVSSWAYAFNEGARNNSIDVGSVNLGSLQAATLVKVIVSSGNRLRFVESTGAALTGAGIFMEFPAYAGTRPNLINNDIDVGVCGILSMTRHAQANFNCNGNRFAGKFIAVPTSGQSITPSSGNRNIYDIDAQAGTIVAPSGFGNVFNVRSGSSNAAGTYEGVTGNYYQNLSDPYLAFRALGFVSAAAGYNSSTPYTKTLTIPANTLIAGDRMALRIRGRGTGSSGTKTLSVTFGGVSLLSKTIAAGQTDIDLDMLIQATSTTAIVGSFRYTANSSTEVGEGQNTSVNVATTAYDLVVSITVASAGDAFSLRAAALECARPQMDGRLIA